MNDIVWRCAQEFCNDGELIDVVLAGEQGLSLEHLSKDTASRPDIDLNVVLLPSEHNLGSSVVSRGNVASHLGILYSRESKIANFEIAILVHQDIRGLQISVDDSRGMDVLQTSLHCIR